MRDSLMKKTGFILLLLISWVAVFSQDISQDKVTLKTGEVYIGEIVLKNNDIVMLKDAEGTRFQFPTSEIRSIEKVTSTEITKTHRNGIPVNEPSSGNVCGLLELSGGFGAAANKFGSSPNGQISLSFGSRTINSRALFIGGGIGYLTVFESRNSEIISFVPLYFRLKNNFSNKQNAPYLLFDAGYSFALTSGYEGGLYSKIGFGFQYNASAKTSVYWGAFTSIQNFAGNLTETRNSIPYNYYGNSNIVNVGLSVGLQF